MFTGIIEEIGQVKSIRNNGDSYQIEVFCKKILDGSLIGDSISTNGVCLTINYMTGSFFRSDIMKVTLRASNLHRLEAGSRVNLERALSLSSRLGGHMVSGHVDTVGEILAIKRDGNATWYRVRPRDNITSYLLEKGSIALDGISLTVSKLGVNDFHVSIIPHTKSQTVLEEKKVGDLVNIEVDLIGKYVQRMLESKDSKLIDSNFLMENGFIGGSHV